MPLYDVLFTNSTAAYDALQGDDVPLYERNSSDSDSDSESPSTTTEQSSRSASLPFTPSVTTLEQQRQHEQPSAFLSRSNSLNRLSESKFVCSQFTPNDDNTIFGSDYVVFGLKPNQNLLIRGQFELEVQRGAIMVNHCIYYSSRERLKFVSPICNALPLIKATQVRDISKVKDNRTNENQHLFSSDYKSVIKCYHLNSGLEKVGNFAPLCKNLFWNLDNLTNEELRSLNTFEMGFSLSFTPVLTPTNQVSVLSHSQYDQFLKSITQLSQSNELLKILIIGGKNSGKSTLLNLSLQSLLHDTQDTTVNILDIDPGQTYVSPPDSISLSKTSKFIHGSSHMALHTANLSQQVSHYVGFTSPKDQPLRFNSLLQDLMNKYTNDGELKNEALLINTPGWVKGYGVNLMRVIMEKIRPTHVVYLHPASSTGRQELEDDEVLNLLKDFQGLEVVPIKGNFGSHDRTGGVKYHSSQLRIFKKLGYFHRTSGDFQFDFTPLLNKAPFQLSYDPEQDSNLKFTTVLNYDDLKIVDDDGYNSLFEGTIVALYTITNLELEKLQSKLAKNISKIPLLKSKDFLKINQASLKFKSLCLIHSIDPQSQLINLYTPSSQSELLKSTSEQYLFVRGATETPIMEIASNEVIKKFKKQGFKGMPFVTFKRGSDLEKVWKVRKNVMRRGQQ